MIKSSNKIRSASMFVVLYCCMYTIAPVYALPPDVRSQCIDFAQVQLLPEDSFSPDKTIDSFFFTPDEAFTLKQIIVGLIDAETAMIKLALFRLTDSDIAQALIDAHKRGVAIELLIDAGGLTLGHYSKASALESHDIPIFVYQPVSLFTSKNQKKKGKQESSYQSIMHHKTFIFYNTIGGSVVVCGSLNPTYAAFHGNEEMVVIRNNNELVAKWKQHFEKLKKRCHQRSAVDRNRDALKRKKTVKGKKKLRN